MKVSELEGALLDYWVARAEYGDNVKYDPDFEGECFYEGYCFGKVDPPMEYEGWSDGMLYRPSSNWLHGGLIIERKRISICCFDTTFEAGFDPLGGLQQDIFLKHEQEGPTPLIAAMRAYVASKFGDEVE